MFEELDYQRSRVRKLLNEGVPADALYVYYALYHDVGRTSLYVHDGANGCPDGFVAVCQTGQRLFVPTVVVRALDTYAAVDLLRRALAPGRPYHVITTPDLREAVAEVLHIEHPVMNRVMVLDLARFDMASRTAVTTEQGPNGLPRFVVRSPGGIVAQAGISWCSPNFAEISFAGGPAPYSSEWLPRVVSACTRWVVRSARLPLCVVEVADRESMALADMVGYVDTGVYEYAGEGVCLP